MRRITWILAIVLLVSVALAGCGTKDAADVVSGVDRVVGGMESYHGEGTLTLHSGQQPHEYKVEVCFMKENYYRITLTNTTKDITQIVLRNDEGVFVLTPHLNKHFRFQSDWPENQGQVYLYQSLARSILEDKERLFTADKDAYVFDVAANYQNSSLIRQKIWLNKDNYAPKHVEVMNENSEVLVTLDFNHFEFGKKFSKDDFSMQKNMTGYHMQSLPTLAEEGELTEEPLLEEGAAAEEQAEETAVQEEAQGSFGIIEPSYIPEGVQLAELEEIQLGENTANLLRYEGDFNYTIVESRPKDRAVLGTANELVDLGGNFAVLSGDVNKTLTWMEDGVEYRLSSADLPTWEMINIAQSVQGQVGK